MRALQQMKQDEKRIEGSRCRDGMIVPRVSSAASIGATALMIAIGCAGGTNPGGPINPNLPVGLPVAPPPASSNSFTGTQSPGLWTVSIDDTQEQYSYQAITYPGVA